MAHERTVCSSVSLAADEPLAGTASRFRFWLLIEQPGRWGHDALVDSGFPPDVGALLKERGDDLGVRTLLIKRRGRGLRARRRCFVAYTGRRERRLAAFDIADPYELAELDLEALVASRFRGLGEPVAAPLWLVCTHGKHDPCCARLGGPLYRGLEGSEEVWEATHVGGDRFAGNLVCLPHGLYFGRVDPLRGRAVVEAYARGEIDLSHFRGRSAYPPAVQAAEVFVRQRLEIAGVDDLVLHGHRPLERGRHIVEFEDASGRRHSAEVAVRRRAPRILTCKSVEPERPRAFVVGQRRPDVP